MIIFDNLSFVKMSATSGFFSSGLNKYAPDFPFAVL